MIAFFLVASSVASRFQTKSSHPGPTHAASHPRRAEAAAVDREGKPRGQERMLGGAGIFACRRLVRKKKAKPKEEEENSKKRRKTLEKKTNRPHPLRRPQLLQVRRGGRRPRRSVREAVSYQSRDGGIDVGPAWLCFLRVEREREQSEGNCTLETLERNRKRCRRRRCRTTGGGRILAVASRRLKELSALCRSRQRGDVALLYVPGLVGLQAGAVVLSPRRHLDAVSLLFRRCCCRRRCCCEKNGKDSPLKSLSLARALTPRAPALMAAAPRRGLKSGRGENALKEREGRVLKRPPLLLDLLVDCEE